MTETAWRSTRSVTGHLVVQRDGQLLDQRALLLGELGGYRHVDRDEQVAGRVLGGRRHPASAHAHRGAALGPRGDLERDRLVERGHLAGGAEHRGGGGHVHRGRHVATAPGEAGVGRDVHVHEEVAGRAAVDAGLALALQADALAVDDPGGHAHVDASRRGLAPGAVTGRTGRDDPPAAAVADRTDARHGEGALVVVEDPAALAALAGRKARARGRAATPAGVAGVAAGQRHRRRRAHHGVAEPQVQGGLEVGPALGALAAPPEEAAEDVAQVAEVAGREVEPPGAGGATEAGGGRAEAAHLVVLLALGVVAQHVVGDRDLLEALLGAGIGVGVQLLGELAVGASDLLVRGARAQAQHLVVVLLEPLAFGHLALHPHHRGTQHHALPAVPRAQHVGDHRTALGVLVGHRVVHLGIEGTPDGVDALEALLGEGVEQQAARLTQGEGLVAGRLALGDEVRQGQVEGVEHRQQLGREVARGARRGVLGGAHHALAVVLEVRLEPLERVEVLVTRPLGLAHGLLVGVDVLGAPLERRERRRVLADHLVRHGQSTISASTMSSSPAPGAGASPPPADALALAASFSSASAGSTSWRSVPWNDSSWSFSSFSVWYTRPSALLRISASARRWRSSSAWPSATRPMRSISSWESDEPPVIVIDWVAPVAWSFAETCTMPFASMSKVTSIWGTPRGAGGIPTSWSLPSVWLYEAISRSPWRTWTSTLGWLSSAVVKVWLFLVGIVVLRSMILVITPPLVSMPRLRGVTSSRRMSFTSPLRTPAWTAAPTATTSSGLTPLLGSLPVTLVTNSWTAGMRVEPPTMMTWSILSMVRPASLMAWSKGERHFSTRCAVSSLNLARLILMSRCLGPSAVAVMKGRFTWVSWTEESSIFAFSAASFRRWTAILSFPRSTPSVSLKVFPSHCITASSQSSPPRWVSPWVDFTSKTPSAISSTDTSKVPPPRSKTSTVCSWVPLSRP